MARCACRCVRSTRPAKIAFAPRSRATACCENAETRKAVRGRLFWFLLSLSRFSVHRRLDRHAVRNTAEVDLVAIVQYGTILDAKPVDVGAIAGGEVTNGDAIRLHLQLRVPTGHHRMKDLVIARTGAAQQVGET